MDTKFILISFILLCSCSQERPDCHYAIGSHATSPDKKYDAAAFLVNCDTGSIESDEFIFVRKHSDSPYNLQSRTWIPVGGIGADDAGPLIEWQGSSDLFLKFNRKSPLVVDKNFSFLNKGMMIKIHQEENMTRTQYEIQKLNRLRYERDDNVLSDFWSYKLGISNIP